MAESERTRYKRKAKPAGFEELLVSHPSEFRDRISRQPKRKYLPGLFEIERIISSRGGCQSKEYLIKWKDYDMSSCTWEPEKNIPEQLIEALYNNPNIEAERVQKAMIGFLTGIKGKLKSKSVDPQLTWDCDHDVFRYLFHGKGCASNVPGAVMLEKEDFTRLLLPSSWHYCLKKNGEGREVEFPIRAKPVLKKSPKHFILNNAGVLVQAPTYLFQVVTFYLTKIPCSIDSLDS